MASRATQILSTFLTDRAALGDERPLLPPTQRPLLLAAVSGGADSMVLLDCLDALREPLQFRLAIIHVDHGLRGQAAAQDAAFVRRECVARGLECHIEEGDTRGRMAQHSLSLEEAARQIRYEAFARVAWVTEARAVVIAHHLDDDVETLLMRLITGSSLHALAGMEPITERHGVPIWRPFLRLPQAVLYTHVKERDLKYQHDLSNLETGMLRNRIRLELLPQIRQDFNPQVVRTLGKLLQELKALRTEELPEVQLTLDTSTPDLGEGTAIGSQLVPAEEWQFPVSALQGLEPRERWGLWKAVLRGLGIPNKRITRTLFEDLDTLISRTHGTLAIDLPGAYEARRTYGTLVFGPHQMTEEVPMPATLRIGRWEWTDHYPGWVVLLEELEERPTSSEKATKPGGRWWEGALFQGTLSLPVGTETLEIRSRQAGDELPLPSGAGHGSLKSTFIDTKLPRLFRARWPVLALPEGPVQWVPGLPAPQLTAGESHRFIRVTAIKTAHWG